ncbi:MAG: enoyl-CoA hydratase/isomerase family protein [Desulfobacteraceae bacterium]|nr:enoyl-CoA hydratase/isomerase family protein [Desulfobacteraceae bacterium]
MKIKLKNEHIVFIKDNHLGIIKLNKPDKLNAISIQMITEFIEVLNFIRVDNELKVIIITGEGEAFSTGADFEFVLNIGTPEKLREATRQYWNKAFDAIEEMEKLFIAAINGIAIGCGLELALACDLRIAAEGVKMGLPEINYGLIPDAGGTIRLTRIVGAGFTKEMILSGESIKSEEAQQIGLINRILPPENFLENAKEYASKFLNKSGTAIGLGKLTINKSMDQDIKSGLEHALITQSLLLHSEEYKRAMIAIKK